MRSQADPYSYANPFVEPTSLDALAVADEDDGEAIILPVADHTPDAEEQLEFARVQVAIQNFIDGLDARDRTLIERVFWEDERQADVARALSVSGAAISKRMTRIMQRGQIALGFLRHSSLLQ
jgi:DNA-directed RNA polymerase specialized sigma24 family protein